MSRIIKPGDRAFYINRNRYVETEGRTKIGIEGRYTIRAIKPGFGVIRELSFPNILTDIGLDAIGGGAAFNRMHLGTGTAVPKVTDSTLSAFGVNVKSGNGDEQGGASGSAPYYGWIRITWTSAVGGATGTWTEIGISNQNTNGNLRSRALILDGGGSPTSFPVLADEQFEGVYEFRVYAPESDNPQEINLSGAPYDTITRALNVTNGAMTSNGSWAPNTLQSSSANSLFHPASPDGVQQRAYTGGLAAVTALNPLGSVLAGAPTVSAAAYGSGNHYIDTSMRRGAGAAVGDIKTLEWMLFTGSFQIEFTPAITKLSTEEFIHNQRISWARR